MIILKRELKFPFYIKNLSFNQIFPLNMIGLMFNLKLSHKFLIYF